MYVCDDVMCVGGARCVDDDFSGRSRYFCSDISAYVCDDLSVSRGVCVYVCRSDAIFQCVGGECVCV